MTTYTQEHGRFKFDISYRRQVGDEGLSISVHGPVANETRELLRFDCFKNRPHYHTEVYGKNEVSTITDDDTVQWSLNLLNERFERLVDAAGADALDGEEHRALADTLNQVAKKSQRAIAEAQRA